MHLEKPGSDDIVQHPPSRSKGRDRAQGFAFGRSGRLSGGRDCEPGDNSQDTGTVTLFAFDKGQGLSEHIAPFDALVHILDGEAEITISGKKYHLVQGQMVILPANKPHALQALSRFKMLLVMIRS